MSESVLPERPHLNWLKNRAKEKLEALRAANPASQLAEAQLLIAREYGFTNWQSLRQRVALLAFQASLDTGDDRAMAELLADNPSLAATTDATWMHPSGKRLNMPPLFTAACMRRNLEMVRSLVDAGENVNDPALYVDGRPDIMQFLLDREKSDTGEKRWRYQPQNPGLTPRDLAIAAGHDQVARMLESRTTPTRLKEETMKEFADAILADINIVRKMLDENPALANGTFEGASILHFAAGENRVAAIRLLIQRGAKPNAVWAGNLHTPLSWAVTVDHPGACKALVECGAKMDLFCAAGMGRLEDVRKFFDDTGHVRPGASTTGSSRRQSDGKNFPIATDPIEIISDALYIACRSGRIDVATYLLERGADPSFGGYMGASCFHWAYFGGGDPKLINAILAHGGDPKSTWGERKLTPRAFGIFTTTGWGWMYYLKRILDTDPTLANLSGAGTTPLHDAARNGNLEVVKLLVERGADISAPDAQGKSASEVAKAADRQAVAEWLLLRR